MYMDKQNLFSEDQAITVTADSTNVIDLGNDNAAVQALNEKGELEIFAQVTLALASGTSVALVVETDDDVNFGSSTVLYTSAAIAQAVLVAGYQFKTGKLPMINEQYIQLVYTVVGTFDAGTITAGLVLDKQTSN